MVRGGRRWGERRREKEVNMFATAMFVTWLRERRASGFGSFCTESMRR